MKYLIGAVAAVLLLSAGAASAAEVSATIGPELTKFSKSYGVEEIEMLRQTLVGEIRQALDHAGPNAPQRVTLVLESATPNRPTTHQISASRLKMSSMGNGGAHITGSMVGADSVTHAISYGWHENDITAVGTETWTDALTAFSKLAERLARGEAPNSGRYWPHLTDEPAFTGVSRIH